MELAVVGARHEHVLLQVFLLMAAGVELGPIHEPDDASFATFEKMFPDCRRVNTLDEILESDSIDLVTGAAIASDRAPLGIEVLRSGKDYICDKPGILDRASVDAVQRAIDETGQRFDIWFHERLSSRAALRALEIAKSGAIGDIVGCTVLAPHRLRASGRPDWFWDQKQAGDIITDIGLHHLDLFLELTDDAPLQIEWAMQDNVALTDHEGFADVATVVVSGPHFLGTIHVDWHSPESLGTWGDGRLFIRGNKGYVEARREIDIAGHDGANHIIWVDPDGIHREQVEEKDMTFAAEYVADLAAGTYAAMPKDRWRRATELALDASEMSRK
jgi:predicted dehydrogenase